MLKWFGNNKMMPNPGKFQYMLLFKHKSLKTEIEDFKLEPAKSVKLLPTTFDHNLTID